MVQTFLRLAVTALIFAAIISLLFVFPFSFPDISLFANVLGFIELPIAVLNYYFPAFLPLIQFGFGLLLFFVSWFIAKWVLLALHWLRGAI